MTTRPFSATDLPHPRYSLELGRLSIRQRGEQVGVRRQRQQQQQPPPPHKQSQDKDARSVGGDDRRRASKDNDGGERGDANDDEKTASAAVADDDVNLPSTCLPRFSRLAQVIEVKRPGLTLPGRVGSNIRDFLGSYCVIENARPELFVRRDFISKFVDKGTIHISHLSDYGNHNNNNQQPPPPQQQQQQQQINQGSSLLTGSAANVEQSSSSAPCNHQSTVVGAYKLATTRANVMTITMNAKQYHRFGMVAKKVISLSTAGPRRKSKRSSKGADDLYLVEIDLRDERIKANNKHQDRLVSALRRLAPIDRLYFRFVPNESAHGEPDLPATEAAMAANQLSLDFFNQVIEEYALDGCQPVPLTKCSFEGQQVDRNWVNYSQLHPELGLGSKLAPKLSSLLTGQRGDVAFRNEFETEESQNALAQLLELVDWLGYQTLEVDCEHLSELLGWNSEADKNTKLDRVDVACTRIIGNVDFKQVQQNLGILFDPKHADDVLLRALVLYDSQDREMRQLQLTDHDSNWLNVTDENAPGGRITGCSGDNNSNNAGVVYLQDLSNGVELAQEILLIGMSKAGF